MKRPVMVLVAAAATGLAVLVAGLSYLDMAGHMSYTDGDLVRQDLAGVGIQMSSAIKLSGDAAAEHCSFLYDSEPLPYCTSTELKYDDIFIGNIHMAGTPQEPALALGIIITENQQIDSVAVVAHYMIRHMACDDSVDLMCSMSGGPGVEATLHMPCSCPAGVFPAGYESIQEWVRQTSMHHAAGDSPTARSQVEGLSSPVLLEVTKTPDGHLWKILVGSAQ